MMNGTRNNNGLIANAGRFCLFDVAYFGSFLVHTWGALYLDKWRLKPCGNRYRSLLLWNTPEFPALYHLHALCSSSHSKL